jgi:hypothetical protein
MFRLEGGQQRSISAPGEDVYCERNRKELSISIGDGNLPFGDPI